MTKKKPVGRPRYCRNGHALWLPRSFIVDPAGVRRCLACRRNRAKRAAVKRWADPVKRDRMRETNHRWIAEHRQRRAARARERYATDPDYRERCKEAARLRRQYQPEKVTASERAYMAKNKERKAAYDHARLEERKTKFLRRRPALSELDN